ncbi:hypothetical protein [Novosphingobium sp.]|uniref:hypothetical protein n=1 Tax=Novosphingobium sp. TaxID=1874826 RepID=UPI00286AA706|nr:hypothetical protein [Novosphingobium sp.]
MTDEADAKTRLFILTAVRLASAALIGVGMAIIVGKIDVPRPAGIAFVIFGLLELLLLPPFLIRKWKTPGG